MIPKRGQPNAPQEKNEPASKEGLRPKIGIALGSGGSRGVVHIGILEGLKELNVPVDMIAGSSIGAVVGGIYVSGTLGKLKKDLAGMNSDDLIKLFDPSLSLSGLFAARRAIGFLERYIPEDARIEDAGIPLGIVATDYETGHPIVFRNGGLLDAIRASMSIPGIFTPAKFGNALLLDGGVSDPLPIDVVESMGADLTVAVSLQPSLGKIGLPSFVRRPKEAPRREAGPAPLHSGKLSDHLLMGGRTGTRDWLQEAEAWFRPRQGRAGKRAKNPNVFEIIVRAVDIMGFTNTLMMLASHPPTILFEFDLPDIPTLDFAGCNKLLDMGRRAVFDKRDEIEEKLRTRIRTSL